MTQSFLIFRSPFFNYLSITKPTQPDYAIINLIFFLRFPSFGFYSGEQITDKNFWSVLILVREKYWSPLFKDKLFATILHNNLQNLLLNLVLCTRSVFVCHKSSIILKKTYTYLWTGSSLSNSPSSIMS